MTIVEMISIEIEEEILNLILPFEDDIEEVEALEDFGY